MIFALLVTLVAAAVPPSVIAASASSSAAVGTKKEDPATFCLLPPYKPGEEYLCKASIPSWTYNADLGKCERFIYNGCGATANVFSSKRSCLKTCGGVKPTPLCELPLDNGPCKGACTRWGFNGKKCVSFGYGCCGGNANNFKTEEACKKRCKAPVDVCSLRPQSGPCKALFKKWYYAGRGRCAKFTYGGCGGNGNRFDTENECLATCSHR